MTCLLKGLSRRPLILSQSYPLSSFKWIGSHCLPSRPFYSPSLRCSSYSTSSNSHPHPLPTSTSTSIPSNFSSPSSQFASSIPSPSTSTNEAPRMSSLDKAAQFLFMTEILRGMALTLEQLFKPPLTIMYPFEKGALSPRFRGEHALRRYPSGKGMRNRI